MKQDIEEGAEKDYIFDYSIAEADLAYGAPLCDMCNDQFEKNDQGIYQVMALVLYGDSIWGLLCYDCMKKWKDTRRVSEADTPVEAKRALHKSLGMKMLITSGNDYAQAMKQEILREFGPDEDPDKTQIY